ncbi:MAG TPA: alkaline shock response membrane anchor protein AmaP [Candidatus Omnitrophota bacterium]|nr:alkaline shock response membrane anchor protein AmaP [Candidatus Omnitrophota bacterium]HPT07631.1 alkaline shock response membrane anchor protein AmaP [Candidatus Omnitrophota bacterium]
MRFLTVLGIVFYAAVLILIGIGLIFIAIILSIQPSPFAPQDVTNFLIYLQKSISSRFIIGFSGLMLVLISYSFAQFLLGKLQREKNIAFSTGAGEVTIALSAVEDLIKRIAGIIPEIKELRPDVIASKKGILVDLRVVLRSEANIPDLTARLQETTKSKIQEVLGIEEEIVVKIHIVKIIQQDDRDRRRRDEKNDAPTIPFSGYGRA